MFVSRPIYKLRDLGRVEYYVWMIIGMLSLVARQIFIDHLEQM